MVLDFYSLHRSRSRQDGVKFPKVYGNSKTLICGREYHVTHQTSFFFLNKDVTFTKVNSKVGHIVDVVKELFLSVLIMQRKEGGRSPIGTWIDHGSRSVCMYAQRTMSRQFISYYVVIRNKEAIQCTLILMVRHGRPPHKSKTTRPNVRHQSNKPPNEQLFTG